MSKIEENSDPSDIEGSDIYIYKGKRDADGEPHGHGTMTYPEGDEFEGGFHHGVKQGKGTFRFADGSSLSGNYEEDSLEGLGIYEYADGSRMEAHYKDGEMNGHAKEYNENGFLIFHGSYKDDTRTGLCTMCNEDGGCLIGTVDEEGCATGDNFMYIYPDRKHALFGEFKDGAMVKAKAAVVIEHKEGSLPNVLVDEKGFTYSLDESTDATISSDPLVTDAYELERVYVKESEISGAGEGLFSLIDEKEDCVMSFYNGIRISHEEVDTRDWSLNGNTISLDEDCVIDVPAQFVPTQSYQASLGHKANHSFTPNCKYDIFDHPRFGSIKCIRTIKPVQKDEELTVFYGYEHQGDEEGDKQAPEWYLTQKAQFEKESIT